MARPDELFAYFGDIGSLPGIGPRNRVLVERVAGARLKDLLFHLPAGVIDRRYRPHVAVAEPGRIATLALTILKHVAPANRRTPYRVLARDDSGFMTLVFFHARADFLLRQMPVGSVRLVSGRVELFQGDRQITHPDYILAAEDEDSLPQIEPVYPLTQGLSLKTLEKAVRAALDRVPALAEWQDGPLLAREGWPSFHDALRALHAPVDAATLNPDSPVRRRLAMDELLASQLALALVRHAARRKRGRSLKGGGAVRGAIRRALPYALTADQDAAVRDILSDMAAPEAMLRLLQGDVGSGKTVVALLAMAAAAEAGAQSALIAPTEILALQHLDGIRPLAAAAGLEVAVLTGRHKGRARTEKLRALADGDIHILIGTHALLEDDVVFRDLGFAVIDEQHRFGVAQRARLAAKADRGLDILGMTATPIPRTLRLAAYGDMDVSRIREKPPGRKPVTTRVVPLSRLDEVVPALSRAVAQGARAYWVCPYVEDSAGDDVAAAEDRFQMLDGLFAGQVGLIHGRMKAADKDAVMTRFQAGEIAILVATTVIEVGVNVPEATIMVIEQAERFGLAQLHQLRGRVGRGAAASTCLLLRADEIGETARRRLNIMRETEDGFVIAEEDLKLRGGGDLLGTRQSGLPGFRLVDMEAHGDLLDIAQDDARRIVATDPTLEGRRAQALRLMLYLFERDEGVRWMLSG